MTRGPLGVIATAVSASGNAKLGDAATTHAAQASCPSSCVFKDGGGCYAETGRQGSFVTSELNDVAAALNASALDVARAEARAIDDMEVVQGRPMRLHTVGDCPTDECAWIVSAAAERYMARGGGPVWTYTHAWRDVDRSSWRTVSVLASCETPADVNDALARGYATAVVVADFDSDVRYGVGTYPHVFDMVPCPSMTRGVACSDCRLCMNDAGLRQRGVTIGFAIHGIPLAQRQARAALTNPDDPMRRVPSVERIAAIRDRYLADEGREPTGAEVAAEIPDLNRASIWEWMRFLRGEIVHPSERRRVARQRVGSRS